MRNSLRSFFSFFTVFWLVFSSGTILFNSQINLPFTFFLTLFLVASHLLLWAGSFSIKKNTLFLYFFMVIWLLLVVVINGDYDAVLTYFGAIVVISFAMTSSVVLDFQYFVKRFVLIVISLATCSLVMFYGDFLGGMRFLFPVIINGDYQYINTFVYAEMIDVDRRNLGVFIEPGIFQIYLNLAMLAILLKKDKRFVDKLSVAVLLLTIFSTSSTTGFVASVVVLGISLFSKNRNESVAFNFAKLIVAFFCIFGLVTSEIFVSNLEEKLYGEKSMSFVHRHNATLADLDITMKNPFFGDGFGNYQKNLNNSGLIINSSANTFTQLSANAGLPFIFVLAVSFVFFILGFKVNFYSRAAFIFLYFLFFSTEPFLMCPIFYLPIFIYGQKRVNNG